MASDTINRQAGRDQLVTLLTPYLTGICNAENPVVGYMLGDFAGAVPAVCVTGGGSVRKNRAYIGGVKGAANFIYQVITIVPDADTTVSWTAKNAEDMLDLIEKKITDCLLDNPSSVTGGWTFAHADRNSQIVPVSKKGKAYLIETQFIATGEVLDP